MSAMGDARQQVNDELDRPVSDWLGDGEFEVVTEPPATVVFSARMPGQWSEEINAEVSRRGLKNPSQLIKALVREGLDRAAAGEAHNPETIEALHHLDAVRRALIEREHTAAA
jgi:Arc/MetJ-type ribon-helix-helix transcriptional regulator